MTEMDPIRKEISNPFSTGGGGVQFEAHVQASFAILMLANGFVPCLPLMPIKKIKLQGKIDGYETDDLIVFMERNDGSQKCKLLGQIKHSVAFTASDSIFSDVVHAAWQDFNNTRLFTKQQDAIAIITGPLSAADIDGARWILEWARSCETAEEFIRNVETAKFSSDTKRQKLQAFRVQLQKANKDTEVSDDQLFEFLRHFHILSYDLDVKSGVVLSLLHSLMNQYSMENVRAIWAQVVDEVQTANKNAGTLTRENFPQDLRAAFERYKYATIPDTYAPTEPEKLDLNQLPHASVIAVANLVGGWDENREADCSAIAKFVDEEFARWIAKLQELLQIDDSPIRLRDGVWHVTQRAHVWQSLGQRVFDRSIDAFKECATLILGERDPKFDLPSHERFGASLQGKILSHSRALRQGVAETLALMGADPKALGNCSDGKVRSVAILSLREIFKDADWVTWGSLNSLLPLLAEAAPEEFLATVERDLERDPCPFDELFRQEGGGVTGENYLTGLLWALESLAWDEQYLVQVCVLLSGLAARDPGGPSGNRPFNSLTTILLPWLPQTEASIEKRIVGIQTVAREQPTIAWKLLLGLLPKQQQISMRSHHPTFRSMASSALDKGVTQQEYWQQIGLFANMVMDLANDDVARLTEIASNLDKFPFEKVSVFAELLASVKLDSKPTNETIDLWKKLRRYILKHQLLAKQKSIDLPEAIVLLESIAKSIEPNNPAYQYQQLFGHNDPEFYRDPEGNWEEKRERQEERRRRAIQEVLDYGGLVAIRDFIEIADESIFVGHTLGTVAEDDVDDHFLPAELTSENIRMSQFLFGYARARFHTKGWEWVQRLSITKWSRIEIGKFFALLPFSSDTWTRVSDLLGESDSEYWIQVNPNPFEATVNLQFAIEKLIENDRPLLAIACLNRAIHDNHPLNVQQAERALLSLLKSSDSSLVSDRYDVMEVIKALQESPDASPDVVGKIEWQFLQLLDRDFGGEPKLLERRLASKPEFFCEIIRLLYRSKDEPEEARSELSPQEQAMAKNAWKLLHDWQRPPGLNDDGTFSGENFKQWLERTREMCTESGHLSVALTHVGCVLFYSPPDPDGLWIHKTIAEALNGRDADKMRTGFRQQIFNSRGVHWVDPSGQQERDLSEQYRSKAESVENAGFQRLASTLREIAESYEREAEQVVKEAEAEKLEDDNDDD